MNLSQQLTSTETQFEITALSGDDILVERLHELGLHQGSVVSVIGRAPFGGPIIIKKSNSFLALRKEEAQCIQIKTL